MEGAGPLSCCLLYSREFESHRGAYIKYFPLSLFGDVYFHVFFIISCVLFVCFDFFLCFLLLYCIVFFSITMKFQDAS